MAKLHEKLQQRTTPALVKLYTEGYVVGRQNGSLDLLEQLTNAKAHVADLTRLVSVLPAALDAPIATPASESSPAPLALAAAESQQELALVDPDKVPGSGAPYRGGELLAAAQAAKEAGALEGCVKFYSEIAWENDLAAAYIAQDYRKYASLLSPGACDWWDALPEKEKAGMQDNRITKGLVGLFREADSLEPVGPYVAEACAIPILTKAEPGSIAVELGHLGAVTNAMSESVTDKQLSES